MKKKIGLLGGTFNPIHNGHIIIAKKVYEILNLSYVILLPTGNPPQKNQPDIASFEDRFILTKTAIEDYDFMEISDLDRTLDGKKNYTSVLLNKLQQDNKNCKFYFIIGEDNILSLPTWHNFEWLIDNINFVVVTRTEKEELKQLSYTKKFKFVKIKPVKISSTLIRESVKKNKDISKMVCKKNEKKIRELYI